MPSRSEVFDCDDGVKFVYDKLERWGVGSVIVLGDLRKTGESYREGDHVWLLVRVGWFNLPIDWGKLRFSRQYLEGYSISYEQLVEFVKQDNRENGDRIIAAPG